MPNGNDLRRTLTDPKPLYFAAGVLDKIREEAPDRIAAVRATDPKDVQARVSKQAKETQAKVSQTLGNIDTDIKKLREQAQHLALQSLGMAAEYAVKARETYDELADRGRGAVKNWRGESDVPEVTVEREPVKVAEPPAEPRRSTAKPAGAKAADGASPTTATAGARRTTTAKTTPAKGATGKSATGESATGKKGTAGDAPKAGGAKSAAQKNGDGKAGNARTGTAKSNGGRKSAPKSDES
ncbi:hypothetical protein GCM10012287_17650 [Streptomyces daqingensis]|uniref:Uncharacterized protein n=1 Tax=Streptomyces daqingensis TaxID=1472640 RepID=A0ABQ2M4P5_9ACTN|nr:hypothetical protein [Streptomyces daqingensis]GGO46692.1 hypothetical protein GCM10012287_17650 [Streptomyces daqingensis]